MMATATSWRPADAAASDPELLDELLRRTAAGAEEILAAPTAFHARSGFVLRDGQPFRRRTGCCLSHRCAGGAVCEDCPLAGR